MGLWSAKSLRHGAATLLSLSISCLLLFPALPVSAAEEPGAGFRFQEVSTNSLGLWEGPRPVLVYNHGVLAQAGVPADRHRSTYIHPIYGLDGEVLTDDFPKDHYHHRGLFWAWPHVKIAGKEYDLWMLKGVRQQFERWLARQATRTEAILGVENGWYLGQNKVVKEEAWFRVWPENADGRFVDCEFAWTPLGQDLTLAGAEGKSYGGLTLRFAPRTNTVITTKLGASPKDLPMTRLPWADLAAQFPGVPHPSGAALFIGPDHPDYPPMWLTRHYGVLCVGWPGITPATFKAGETFRGRYRLWIHKGVPTQARLTALYNAYVALPKPVWPAPAPTK